MGLIRFLRYAIASNDETRDHLDSLVATGSLNDPKMYKDLSERLDLLGKKLNLFIKSVEGGYRSERESS